MPKEHLILIVDQDFYFREELYNFLLSANYLCLDTADNYEQALDKIVYKTPDVVLLTSKVSSSKEKVKTIEQIDSTIRVIIMITAEEQQWIKNDKNNAKLELMIKNTFAQNLLYMLNSGADKQKFN